ncbi:MAG TPA: DAK2 domain-containing protein [Firmicutes bacterium]|nr:DAK2 domain-containing protein [Bacillota bacterium]
MINGSTLRDAILSGAHNIGNHKTAINDLNIFPVPDGDTGTNMSMTIGAAASELQKSAETSAESVSKTAASLMLRGARGNSGVILSLLFRGFAKGLEGKDMADGRDLAEALRLGVDAAYKAVMNPTEGTILTVARVAAEKAAAACENDTDPVYVWAAACLGASEALETTPQLLPVLKKAGVVDAGGQGLCMIFDGILSVLRDGVIVEEEKTDEEKLDETAEFFRNVAAEFDQEIHFTYCTEFVVGRDPDCENDPADLRSTLEAIGDCVVVVDDDDIIKVHVHTEEPGTALQAGLQYGSLLTIKVENMKEQHRKAAEENEAAKSAAAAKKPDAEGFEPAEPTEELGFVAVAAGEGMANLFRDLGCTQIVSGGQTMNPSTETLMQAVLATPAHTVMILPNNKNIIMAAEQVIPLVNDRTVVVLPTRTIPQGMSAMLAYDPDSPLEENQNAMMTAASHVATGQVTYAARTSEFGGHKIREGEIMGLANGKLEITGDNASDVCVKLVRSMASRHTSFITVLYGAGVTDEDAADVERRLRSKLRDDIEITFVNGGQPVYSYVISIE